VPELVIRGMAIALADPAFAPSSAESSMADLLLADPHGLLPLSLLPLAKSKPTSSGKSTGSKAGGAELQVLEQRLVRLEQLVLLIAQQVGVSPEAITQLAAPSPFRQPEADLCWRQPMTQNQETLEKLGRFLLRNDWTGGISAGVAWLVFLQVERRLPPLRAELEPGIALSSASAVGSTTAHRMTLSTPSRPPSSTPSMVGAFAYEATFGISAAAGIPLPVNSVRQNGSFMKRQLDCAVIQLVHKIRESKGMDAYDTVDGVFEEGELVYPGAGFRDKTHV
jgi:hypothetical protein